MKKFLLPLTLLFFVNSFAQHTADNWYFGMNAGITFSTVPPSFLPGNLMQTPEGSASLSDTSGNLLFYTNGNVIWTAGHTVMPNGTGLNGSLTCSQSALFVPHPGNSQLYYLFTPPDQFSGGSFCYSIVDLSLNGGSGDITNKNTPLFSPSTEKVAAVGHSNGIDTWVIGHSFNNADFYAYLITSAGINTTPVISTAGSIHTGVNDNKIGIMKASSCGNKLALTVFDSAFVDLFDFDNATGVVSNGIRLGDFTPHLVWGLYGLEFSADGSRLYVTQESPALLIQYDLLAGSPAAMTASADTIRMYTSISNKFAGLQIGPDDKIYVCRLGEPFLGCINNPNALGAACNFVDSSIVFPSGSAAHGLPSFMVEACIAPSVGFYSSDTSWCDKKAIDFFDISTNNPTSWQWYFPGAVPDTSTLQNPAGIYYSAFGTFDVMLVACNSTDCDSLFMPAFITVFQPPPAPVITQSNDTLYSSPAAGYQWYDQNGPVTAATGSWYVFMQPGTYFVVVTDSIGCSTSSASIIITSIRSDEMNISQVYSSPNPFSDETDLYFNLERSNHFNIDLYDATGRKIKNVFSGTLASGHQKIKIDGKNLNSGVYFCRIQSQGNFWVIKVVLSR